jgi:hypothetical protein
MEMAVRHSVDVLKEKLASEDESVCWSQTGWRIRSFTSSNNGKDSGGMLGRREEKTTHHEPGCRSSVTIDWIMYSIIYYFRNRKLLGESFWDPSKGSVCSANNLSALTRHGEATESHTVQPPASRTFLSEQTSHQQSASSAFLSEQTSTSRQPPAKRTGC